MLKPTKKIVLLFALLISAVAGAQVATTPGKIAVLDAQGAILSTDEAQKKLKAFSAQPEFDTDKKQFEKLKKEFDDMVKQFQKDGAVMSNEQKEDQRKKLETKQSDIEYLGRKLQGKQQELVRTVMQDQEAKFKKAVADLIKSENIGLLLDVSTVMHVDNSYNITSKVTDALNKANSQ